MTPRRLSALLTILTLLLASLAHGAARGVRSVICDADSPAAGLLDLRSRPPRSVA